MAKERLDICDGCPSKRQLNSMGAMVIGAINLEASIYTCGECGCPLAAKTMSPTSVCPLGKWGKQAGESYF